MFASEEWPSDALTGRGQRIASTEIAQEMTVLPYSRQVYLDIYIYINKIFVVNAQAIAARVTGFLYEGTVSVYSLRLRN